MTERDLSGLRAYAHEVTSRYEQLQEGLSTLQRELAEVSVPATSPDGYITATVGARGQLLALKLDPRIYRRPDSTALSATIVETVRRAVEEAGAQVRRISERHAPGADVASMLQGELAERFRRFDFIEEQISGGGDDG
jgi:DNA-binding protein YbaB